MIPAAELRRLSQRLVALQDRIDLVEKSQRATQLSNSSIENGRLVIRDADGLPRGYVGMQPDGNSGLVTVNNPAPARPNTPELVQITAGLGITWNGELFDGPPTPGNFSHVKAYLSGAGEDFIHGPSNLVGALSRAGTIPVTPLSPGTYWVRLVAYNNDDPVDASEPSFTVSGTAQAVVAQELLDGIVTEVKLAEGAVSEAKLAAGSVTETKVAPDSIQSPHIVAGGIQAINLAAGSVQTDKLAAGSVVAEKIGALEITGDKIAANAITSGHVEAGAVTTEKLDANLVVAGDPGGDRVEITKANGIEQHLDGVRTLSIPPDGSAVFGGTVHAGNDEQFIELRPDSNGFPRIDMVDNVGTRQITFVYQADAGSGTKGVMILQRELQATRAVDGGSLSFGNTDTRLRNAPNNVTSGELAMYDSGDIDLVGGGTVTITADSAVSIAADTDFTVTNSAGTRIRSSGGDLYLESGGGDAGIQMFSDGFLQFRSEGANRNFTGKAFIIPHPLDGDREDRWLVHCCTETPDAMVEYTGIAQITDRRAVVELPTYFEALVREDSRQVLVTQVLDDEPSPDGDVLYRVAASTPKDGRFRIACDGPDGTRIAWKVTAPRRDAGGFDVEPLRADVDVHGDGPYRYLTPKTS
jgi:hypothetical protein